MIIERKFKTLKYIIAIIVVSLVLTLPQITSKAVLSGPDFIFHANRFYDTAMQMRTGNYSYYIHLFGYEQSGRIVNALYGPVIAYFNGALLLLSGTWFRYQVFSRILIQFLAGFSMLKCLASLKIRMSIAFPISIIFMTTFAVQYFPYYWGFTSWAIAIFPICLHEVLVFCRTGEVRPYRIAISVATMIQFHILSALFLVTIYAIVFFYYLFLIEKKMLYLRKGVLSAIIFLFLSANIWIPIIILQINNKILSPFININFVNDTINGPLKEHLQSPSIFMVMIFLTFALFLTRLKCLNREKYLLMLLSILFLLSSTNMFPWRVIYPLASKIFDLIQFPFRFFMYGTVTVLILLGMVLESFKKNILKYINIVLLLVCSVSVITILSRDIKTIENDYKTDHFMQYLPNITRTGTDSDLKLSMHTDDLSYFLKLYQKPTSDYLPIYLKGENPVRNIRQDPLGYYWRYKKYIIDQNNNFIKYVDRNSILVKWNATEKNERIHLPIILYKGSQLFVNNQKIRLNDSNMTSIGSPIVESKLGENIARLEYSDVSNIQLIYFITLLSWVIFIIYHLVEKQRLTIPSS